MAGNLELIEEHVKKIAQRESCVFYDLEMSGSGRHRVLRVFIDKEGSESVSIDDCSRVSRALDLILDVEDLVPEGSYQLEVSSPGLERHLRHPWHFAQAMGEKIQLQLLQPLGDFNPSAPDSEIKRKKLEAVVLAVVDDEKLQLALERKGGKEEVVIPLSAIKKAKVVFDFVKKTHPKRDRN